MRKRVTPPQVVACIVAGWLSGAAWAGPADGLPAGVTVLVDEPGRIVLEVETPEPEMVADLPGAPRLHLPGYGVQQAPGLPVVPRLMLRLAVPENADIQVSAQPLARRTVRRPLAVGQAIDHAFDPAAPQGPGHSRWRPRQLQADLPLPYPARLAEVVERGRLRDLSVARLQLTPVQLLDRRGTLSLARRLRVSLTWPVAAAAVSGQSSPARRPGVFGRLYGGAVANPAAVERSLLTPAHRGKPADRGIEGTAAGSAGTGSVESLAVSGNGMSLTPTQRAAVPVTPVAGSTTYRLSLSQDGVYRLTRAWIQSNAGNILAHPTAKIFLAANGVEIPIRVVDGGDGNLNGSDYLEFFGEMVDEDPMDADDWLQGDFTDTRPYYLGVADGSRLRFDGASVPGTPVSGYTPLTSFQQTVRVEVNNQFLSAVPDDFSDRWYHFDPNVPAPATNPLPLLNINPEQDVTVPVPGLDSSGTGSLAVRLMGDAIAGNAEGYHRTRVLVNGGQVDQADWDGHVVFTHGQDNPVVSFPSSQLSASTTVRVELPLDRVVNSVTLTQDLVFLDWTELTYPRLFAAVGDRLLITVPNAPAEITVTGLTGSDVAAYDVTPTSGGVAAPLHLSAASLNGGGGNFSLTFEIDPADVPGPDRVIAVSGGPGLQPDAVAVYQAPTDLYTGGADWVLLGEASLLDQGGGSSLSALVALRQAQGLSTLVVTDQEVYDHFSWGLKDPQAIRDFILWGLSNWSTPPTYVVGVGDATFDYKNDYGNSPARNLLPTYIGSQVTSPVLTYFAEDNKFAAVLGGDLLPDVLWGRIPAHTQAEAEDTFDKIVAYEGLASGAPWTRRAFFVSDVDTGGFEFTMRTAINNYFDRPENPGFRDPNTPCFSTGNCENSVAGPGPVFGTASFHTVLQRNPGASQSAWQTKMAGWLRDGFDTPGASVGFVISHGGFQQWGGSGGSPDFWETEPPNDAGSLSNGATLPFLININCISGGFHGDSPPGGSTDRLYSMAEDWLLTSGRGSIGVLAPSHLTFISILGAATNALMDRLLGEARDRELGALNLALRLQFDQVGADIDLRSYAFLADPATRLILPDPAPPGVPLAVAGNGVVDLSWTAGDGVTFQVQRSSGGPAGPYQTVSPGGHATTTYSDTSAQNATSYHYRIVGRDGTGMDSVPSNLNDDCPGGPGCVEATPINPNPPATPTGFALDDAGSGGRLQITWNANPEDDIGFYRLRYGNVQGVYTDEKTFASNATSGLLEGLENGERIYAVLEAVNTSGLSSQTGEADAVPHLVLGLAPPGSILDLRVHRDLADTVLTWSQVQTDIYDRPTTVMQYRVYESMASPSFPTDISHLRGTVTDGPSPSFRDTGAAVDPAHHFYLVLASDTAGLESASGAGLPAGILDLRVTDVGGGTYRLTWSPVIQDVGGLPTMVDHYVVYGAATPFSRDDISSMIPLRPIVGATTVDILKTEGTYFSVLAVDGRGDVSPF